MATTLEERLRKRVFSNGLAAAPSPPPIPGTKNCRAYFSCINSNRFMLLWPGLHDGEKVGGELSIWQSSEGLKMKEWGKGERSNKCVCPIELREHAGFRPLKSYVGRKGRAVIRQYSHDLHASTLDSRLPKIRIPSLLPSFQRLLVVALYPKRRWHPQDVAIRLAFCRLLTWVDCARKRDLQI